MSKKDDGKFLNYKKETQNMYVLVLVLTSLVVSGGIYDVSDWYSSNAAFSNVKAKLDKTLWINISKSAWAFLYINRSSSRSPVTSKKVSNVIIEKTRRKASFKSKTTSVDSTKDSK